jgi:hypothetical protein
VRRAVLAAAVLTAPWLTVQAVNGWAWWVTRDERRRASTWVPPSGPAVLSASREPMWVTWG